jgi:hypothetical protein
MIFNKNFPFFKIVSFLLKVVNSESPEKVCIYPLDFEIKYLEISIKIFTSP